MNRFTITFLCAAAACAPTTAQNLVEVATKAGQFNTLLAAAKAAGLAETLATGGPFTVFAPTDEAFAKLGKQTIADLLKPENKDQLIDILQYHILAGAVPSTTAIELKTTSSISNKAIPLEFADKILRVAGAQVVKADIEASNGVIHVIDSVMMPPEQCNLVGTAASAGKFATLLAAAKAAGLVDVLANGGPFTVFAPTDDAFAKLGDDTMAELLEPANQDRLAAILKYHVVAGTVPSSAAVKLDSATSITGEKLTLKVDGKVLRVNNAQVIMADVTASNGVIHVIDAVLLPQS